MDGGDGAAGKGGHHLAVLDGIEAVRGGTVAPGADVLAVEGVGVVKGHVELGHGPCGLQLHIQAHVARAVDGAEIQHILYQPLLGGAVALVFRQGVAHVVRQQHGGVGQGGIVLAAGGIFMDEIAVFVHSNGVGVAQQIHLAHVAGGVLADIHTGGGGQHGLRLLLDGVDGGGGLGVAVHIHDAVVANAVAAAEVQMGVVVEHAPAEGAGNLAARGHVVEHLGVAQGVGGGVGLGVKELGGEHVAVILGDEIGLVRRIGHVFLGLATPVVPLVDEIVIGVHVLQQVAVLDAPHAAGGAGGVQSPAEGVGLFIQSVIVPGLVDAHAPEDDGGVVAVLAHHVLHVAQGLGLPVVAADVLPAGDLGEHQQAQLVAAVDEVGGLGIVGGADGVAVELVFQNVGVQLLHAGGHGVAHVGVALVAVEAPELHLFAVEEKAVFGEHGLTEADAVVPAVQHLAAPVQLGAQGVEMWLTDAPGLQP